MARVPYMKREDLSPEGQAAWDYIVKSRGQMLRPYELLMASPWLGARVADVGLSVRKDSTLPDAARETIILTVARELQNAFEYTYHEDIARKNGVRESVIESIRTRKQKGMIPQESVFVDYARQVIGNRVNDATFQAVEHLVGQRGAVEATLLASFYALMCLTMNALRLELPANVPSKLPAP
ncbi:MAG: carboxymuconolactone decarboxylase family protein [Chloroflexi bacterium]|nr:carboxymuconolactone decarboxylase family protein [Chloroflexota bacterium]